MPDDAPAGAGMQAPAELAATVAECRESHARLLATLDDLDDATASAPSRLPGWTVAHVVAHLARNADSFSDMLAAAGAGRSVPQYPGGRAQRDGDIERGAVLPARQLLADLKRANERLEAAFATSSAVVWAGSGISPAGEPLPCARIPWRRWREVEFHHADLGFAYGPESWPASFVSASLAEAAADLDRRVPDPAQQARILAWISGRAGEPGPVDFSPW